MILENETQKFEMQMDQPIPTRIPDIVLINKKKNFSYCGFTVSADYRRKLKGSGKIDKYSDFARELKKQLKLGNMKVMVIPIVIGALGTVFQSLEK